jgi:hypothetical protein
MTGFERRMSEAVALDVTGRLCARSDRLHRSISARAIEECPTLRARFNCRGDAALNARNRKRAFRMSSFTASYSQGVKPHGRRH